MKFIPIREAKAKFSEILRDAKKEDIIITSWGKPKALLQNLEEEDFEDYIISHSKKIRDSIEKSWEAYKRGELTSLDEIKESNKKIEKV
ncbi:MAG: type II toxin-antitoxin system Phd/YefM family antitoxin [Candidatus Aerophobetes bacterium]|nr:type II toxin-antitoxin system Phd/YefM family antitoxin [Candidatus Aerophobetes bacterium]